ncbi:MAG: TonB-dependent receptor domain-containing protein [Pseudomonadota bacterium]
MTHVSFRRHPLARSVAAALFAYLPLAAVADDGATMTLPVIEVVGGVVVNDGLSSPGAAVGTDASLDAPAIRREAGLESLSFEKALRRVPGVDVTSTDPFGAESNMRIRGKSHSNHGRTGETLEGLPLKGIGPGKSITVDLENMQSISVIKGAVPAGQGLGFGTDVGMVDLRLRRPAAHFGGQVRQVLGTEAFQRSFVRLDTGELGGVARAFVSGSYSRADKWKGAGRSPDGDTNLTFGLTGTPDQPVTWEVFGYHNESAKHDYRGLNYAQSQDLDRYDQRDYREALTGDPVKDADYYDYNRQSFDSDALFGRLGVPIGPGELTIRPYWSTEDGYRLFGNGDKVIRWLIDHDTYGVKLDWRQTLADVDVTAGYWYGVHEPPGPPTAMKALSTADLSFLGWARLEKAGDHVFHSPFVQLSTEFGDTRVSGGLKFLSMQSPDLTIYDTAGLTDAGYPEVLAQDPDVALYLGEQTHELWLPNIGLTHQLTPEWQLRASYGRNFYTPNYSFGGQVLALMKQLPDSTLNRLWADLEPEVSDNVDLGVNWEGEASWLASTAFFSHVENKGSNLYDPDLGLEYHQNRATARSWGLELAAGHQVTDSLDVSASVTWNRYTFTEDLSGAGGTVIHSDGNQIPNTPELIASLSADWQVAGFDVTPTVRYVGTRYADVENVNDVDAHTTADLTVSRDWKWANGQKLTVAAAVTNLFDERYIAEIHAPDAASPTQTGAGATGSTDFYPGAPRTFLVSASWTF